MSSRPKSRVPCEPRFCPHRPALLLGAAASPPRLADPCTAQTFALPGSPPASLACGTFLCHHGNQLLGSLRRDSTSHLGEGEAGSLPRLPVYPQLRPAWPEGALPKACLPTRPEFSALPRPWPSPLYLSLLPPVASAPLPAPEEEPAVTDSITKGPSLGHFVWLLLGLLSLLQKARGKGARDTRIPKKRYLTRAWGTGWLGSWEKARPEPQYPRTGKGGKGTEDSEI